MKSGGRLAEETAESLYPTSGHPRFREVMPLPPQVMPLPRCISLPREVRFPHIGGGEQWWPAASFSKGAVGRVREAAGSGFSAFPLVGWGWEGEGWGLGGYLGRLADDDSPFAKLIARCVSQRGCACLWPLLSFPLLGASRAPPVVNQNRCSEAN